MHSRQTVLLDVQFSGYPIGSYVVWFENRSETVVLLLRNGIILMVVTSTTVHGDPQESLCGMLHGVVEPNVAIELVPVSSQKSSGSQGSRILRRNLVCSQHLDNHPIITLVCVHRFNDPVPPSPDMFPAVANLVSPSSPIAVSPDVHPVPAPPFAEL